MKNKILTFLYITCIMFLPMVILTGCDNSCKSHKYSAGFMADDTQHWHECEKCGIKAGFGEHTWGEPSVYQPATPTGAGLKLYTCTICDKTKIEEYTWEDVGDSVVTEEEFTNAVNIDAMTNIRIYIYKESDQQMMITKDEDNFHVVKSEVGKEIEYIYSKTDNDYFYYYKASNGSWVKEEIDQVIYEEERNDYAQTSFVFSDFTYNPDLMAYTNESYTLYFENNKLVKIKYNDNSLINKSIFYDQVFVINIDDIERYVRTSVTEEEFYAALDFSCVTNCKLTFTDEGSELIIKDNDKYYCSYTGQESIYSKEGDSYFGYVRPMTDKWMRREIAEEEYNDFVSNYFEFNMIYDDFTYEQIPQAYKTRYSTMLCFEDKKLVGYRGSYNADFDYGSEFVVALPKEEEIAKTTVTEEEFNAAVDFSNQSNVKVTSLNDDGSIAQILIKETNNEGKTNIALLAPETNQVMYILSNYEDEYYLYRKLFNGKWYKETIGQVLYDFIYGYFQPNVTYNEVTEVVEMGLACYVNESVVLLFQDGKLATYIPPDGSEYVVYNYSSSYVVAMPSEDDIVETTDVTEEEFNAALDIDSFAKFRITIYTEYGDVVITKDGYNISIEYPVQNLDCADTIYTKEEDGKYYQYILSVENWIKTEISEDQYNEIGANNLFNEELQYSDFSFDMDRTMGFQNEDITLYFQDGKLVASGAADGTIQLIIEYDGDFVVEAPEVYN